MAAIEKRVLCPERLRHVPPQLSWIDHRLVRDKHIATRSVEALSLYLFLAAGYEAPHLPLRGHGR